MTEMIPSPIQHVVWVCNQIAIIILYYISYRLVILLEFIDALYKFLTFLFLLFCF